MINIPHKPVSILVIMFTLFFVSIIAFGVGFAGSFYFDWVAALYMAIPIIFMGIALLNYFKTSKILNFITAGIALLFFAIAVLAGFI